SPRSAKGRRGKGNLLTTRQAHCRKFDQAIRRCRVGVPLPKPDSLGQTLLDLRPQRRPSEVLAPPNHPQFRASVRGSCAVRVSPARRLYYSPPQPEFFLNGQASNLGRDPIRWESP